MPGIRFGVNLTFLNKVGTNPPANIVYMSTDANTRQWKYQTIHTVDATKGMISITASNSN